jgi:hypothetical protein
VSVYTVKILTKLVTSGRTNKKRAVGHDHVNVKKIEIFINHQLIKIKFTLKQDLKRQQLAACSATKTVQVDRVTIRLQAALLNTIRVIEMRFRLMRERPKFRLTVWRHTK